MDASDFGPLDEPTELAAVLRLEGLSYGVTPEGCERWLRGGGLDNLRVLRGGATRGPQAALLRIPMGQYIAGRPLPCVGIAGVAVAPEVRGRGLARALMTATLREARARGETLSCLFPTTQPLYRQVGYEQAGYSFRATIPLVQSRGATEPLDVTPLGDAVPDAVKRCYAGFARAQNGLMDRGAYLWDRVVSLHGKRYFGFGVGAPGAADLEGYVYLDQRPAEGTNVHLVVSDLAFTTSRAARRLLDFLGDFATVSSHARLTCGPAHPLLLLLPQQRFEVAKYEYWMLRLVDVRAALEGRPYPAGLRARLDLWLDDPVFDDQSGAWSLTVGDGRGTVSRAPVAAAGALRLGVGALAALYSGFLAPAPAQLVGALTGSAEALDAAAAVFATATPWSVDAF